MSNPEWCDSRYDFGVSPMAAAWSLADSDPLIRMSMVLLQQLRGDLVDECVVDFGRSYTLLRVSSKSLLRVSTFGKLSLEPKYTSTVDVLDGRCAIEYREQQSYECRLFSVEMADPEFYALLLNAVRGIGRRLPTHVRHWE